MTKDMTEKMHNPFADYGYEESNYLVNNHTQAEIRMKQIAEEAVSEGTSNIPDILGSNATGIEELKEMIQDGDDTTGILPELRKKANTSDIQSHFYTQEDVNKLISQLTSRIENVETKESIIVADNATGVQNATPGSNIVLTSSEAIDAMVSSKEFSSITMVGGNSDVDIKLAATDKITINGTTINGIKGSSNGRMIISSNDVTIKNVEIANGSTVYNVFEGNQNVNKPEYITKDFNASNINCDNTLLKHNVFNIYTLSNEAVVNIKDSYFNLDVNNSNVLRLANYTNATNVTINFENVKWTYENVAGSDWSWAGLIIYQPASSDKMLHGDDSAFKTWKFNFKNCEYNGEKVTENNFGQHNQVFYLYNVNNTGAVTDPTTISELNIAFE